MPLSGGTRLGPYEILSAIGALVAAQAAPESSSGSPAPRSVDTAERRQVTVMFTDLVGSTELAARMELEDLRDIIAGYQKCVTEALV